MFLLLQCLAPIVKRFISGNISQQYFGGLLFWISHGAMLWITSEIHLGQTELFGRLLITIYLFCNNSDNLRYARDQHITAKLGWCTCIYVTLLFFWEPGSISVNDFAISQKQPISTLFMVRSKTDHAHDCLSRHLLCVIKGSASFSCTSFRGREVQHTLWRPGSD